jgi:hypothetical protein
MNLLTYTAAAVGREPAISAMAPHGPPRGLLCDQYYTASTRNCALLIVHVHEHKQTMYTRQSSAAACTMASTPPRACVRCCSLEQKRALPATSEQHLHCTLLSSGHAAHAGPHGWVEATASITGSHASLPRASSGSKVIKQQAHDKSCCQSAYPMSQQLAYHNGGAHYVHKKNLKCHLCYRMSI